MDNLEYGLIGNCNISALIDPQGTIVWSCMPRFDGDPMFCALLQGEAGGRGKFAIEVANLARCEQRYMRNTAILVTTLYDGSGGVVEVTDFAPRFRQFGRAFYPMMLVRRIRPLAGSPLIRIRLEPASEYGAGTPALTFGSNHIRYVSPQLVLRLTTDASIAAVLEESAFVLDRDLTLLLGPDETVPEAPGELGQRFFGLTRNYWHDWVRFLGIPFEWQEAVIRAAITIKLAAFEDTGAIVAAMTTSLPESAASGRNWDYRHCWLRDGYFVVSALNRLSATRTMERYLHYIVNIAANLQPGERLQAVYGINGLGRLDESVVPSLSGFQGMAPVRVGNAAFKQVQNDVYGAVVLSAMHVFFDERLDGAGTEALFRRLETLGEMARAVYREPDAGIWELRNSQRVHTFSSVMCWVACDRLARIAARLGLDDRAGYWRAHADTVRAWILDNAWDAQQRSFVASIGGHELDASLLLLNELGFLDADDPRFAATVTAIGRRLKRGDFIFRYAHDDDFGQPQTAFVVCTFWYVDALAALGRRDEARALFETLLGCRNSLGLLSEDIDPATRRLWGNFPQTYSMVGLINSAVRLSASWEGVS
ncbi:MAG: glycoside hydrolase family 15 protein [Thermoanaerobaculaceae bacterium]|nr:glycoside hydrolase family 15 protein [Thermoanaerobaculaceae bacterium]